MAAITRMKKESVAISILGNGMAGDVVFVIQPKMLCPAAGPAKLEPAQEALMLPGIMASSSTSSTSACLCQTGLQIGRKGGSGKQSPASRGKGGGTELMSHGL